MAGTNILAMRGGGVAIVLAAALALAGCSGVEHVYFRPAGAYDAAGSAWIARGRYDLPPGQSNQAELQVAARGAIETKKGGLQAERIEVTFLVRNRGPAAFTLDPAAVKLLDDEGREVAGAAYRGKNRTGVLTIAGGAGDEYTFVFGLPPATRLLELGSIRIVWPYRYADKAYEFTTKFLRIEEVDYYEPSYGPWPYDPFWHDPWYEPYGPWHHPYYGPHHHSGMSVGVGYYRR